MKKIVSFILAFSLLLSLSACVKNGNSNKIELDESNYQKYLKLDTERDFDWEGFAGGKSTYSHLSVWVSFEGISQNYEYSIDQIDFKVSVTMIYFDGDVETIEKTGSINSFDISGASINPAKVELSGDKSFLGDEGYKDLKVEVTAINGNIIPVNMN